MRSFVLQLGKKKKSSLNCRILKFIRTLVKAQNTWVPLPPVPPHFQDRYLRYLIFGEGCIRFRKSKLQIHINIMLKYLPNFLLVENAGISLEIAYIGVRYCSSPRNPPTNSTESATPGPEEIYE